MGVDVGGTKIQSAAMRSKQVVGVHRLPTPLTGAKDVVAAIGETVAKALADGGAQATDLDAVGMGVPGAIETQAGTVSSSPNLPGFQAAAPEPKEVRWYDSGHFLPPEADCDAAAWFAEQIGTSPDMATC